MCRNASGNSRLSRRAFYQNARNGNKPLNCGALARSAPAACWAVLDEL